MMDNENEYQHPHLGHLRQRKQLGPPNLSNGNLLVGFRFVPTDVELIYYLQTKVGNWPMPLDTKKIIREVELSNFSPQQLTEMHRQLDKDQKEWYFFTPRERKYPGGERPSRSAGDGYWKPTGKETMIEDNGAEVGSKKVLDFFHGKQPRGTKTNWKMHEYVLKDNKIDRSHNPTTSQNRMELNKWVLCKIYEIKREKKKKNVDEPAAEDDNKHKKECGGISQKNDNAKKNKQNPKQDFGQAIKNSNQIDASPCNSCLDDQSYQGLDEMMRNCPVVPLISQYWPPINNSESSAWDLPNFEAGECSLMHKRDNLHDGLHGLVGYPYNIQQGGAASTFDDQLLLGSNLAADDHFPQLDPNNCCCYLNNQQPPLIDDPDLQFGHNQQQFGRSSSNINQGQGGDASQQFINQGQGGDASQLFINQGQGGDASQQFINQGQGGDASQLFINQGQGGDASQQFINQRQGGDASQQFGRPNKSSGSNTIDNSTT